MNLQPKVQRRDLNLNQSNSFYSTSKNKVQIEQKNLNLKIEENPSKKSESEQKEEEMERMKKWIALEKLRKEVTEHKKSIETNQQLRQFNEEILKKAQEGKIEECLKIFESIIKEGFEPNAQTFGLLIGYYSNVGNREEMEDWFDKMLNLTTPNALSFNALMNYYGKEGLPHELIITASLMIKKSIKMTRTSYTILDRFFSQSNNRKKTIFWFKRSQESGLNFNTITYNLLLRYLTRGSKEKIDLWLKVMNDNKVELTASTYNTVINVFQSVGDAESAQLYLQKMEKAGFRPDTYTCVSMMKLYSHQNDLTKMMIWFEKVPSEFKSVAYNTIIDFYCRKKDSINVEFWFSSMQEEGVKPNTVTYNILMKDAIQQGNKQRLAELGKEMVQEKLIPNEDTRKLLHHFLNQKDNKPPSLSHENEIEEDLD
eukprot:TRINITY_DN2548_c0_g3_i1.p1 TRINITY_DN2548_c0_g3~~TRINITY_DN2548_c0_g3_i1.p1  ORF type:complete len:484 (+),score=149.38 TRINITY_DN2548_c0_g3_i1:173-1453(+)